MQVAIEITNQTQTIFFPKVSIGILNNTTKLQHKRAACFMAMWAQQLHHPNHQET